MPERDRASTELGGAGRFPYACSAELALPRYVKYRAEGRALTESLWNGISYVRKYWLHKTTAPAEELRYFDQQRLLVRFLSGQDSLPHLNTRLAMVGDLMWLRTGWQTFLDPEVLEYLNGFDAVLGNLETVISPNYKVPAFLPDYFRYNSAPGLVTSFRRADGRSTFAALSTANNHTLDHGDRGILDTMTFLDDQGIVHAGVRRHAGDKPYVTFTVNGIKIGFYAACWGMNDAGRLARSRLRIQVLDGLVPEVRLPVDLGPIQRVLADMAAEGVEFRIVYLHWGYEFEHYPCPQLMLVGRDIIRAGADVLMGSHPHVVQPLEVCLVNGYDRRYGALAESVPALRPECGCLLQDEGQVPRKALIAYSLGNFTTAMYPALCRVGLVLGIRIGRDPQTGRIDWGLPECRLVYNQRRDAQTGARRLVLLDRHLQRQRVTGKPDRGAEESAFLVAAHLLGRDAGIGLPGS